jgi:hypothetical protein
MNWCEQSGMAAGCNQGRDCPVRAQSTHGTVAFPRTVNRSCDELGVCQHPAKQCQAVCQLPTRDLALALGDALDEIEIFRTRAFWLVLVAAATFVVWGFA